MKKISIIFAIHCIFSIFSYSQTIVKGKVINSETNTVRLISILSNQMIAEQKLNEKGEYSFNLNIQQTDFIKLAFDEYSEIYLIPEPGKTVVIDVDIKDMNNPKIIGSPETQKIYSQFATAQKLDAELLKFTEETQKKKKDAIRNMINENPNSLSCLFFIQQLDPKEDYELHKKLADGLEQYKYNNFVSDFILQVAAMKANEIGEAAAEISLPNPDGQTITLSSFKGKYVLIDFWASWCGPCRAESQAIVALYNKYNPKGFEILSVSLDQDKTAWINAIKKDNLDKWTHISDLKGWSSQAGALYNVTSIPFTVLVDKDGKVIAKGLRGKDLEQKLEEIFN